ncbi:MAG: ABC transporter ATP-binding protein/permease [Bacilli bacterium]|nr:ABC transporter ATP-binding protein/permease [Bacilli bacterium]
MLELKNIKKSYKVGDNLHQVLKGIDIKFRKSEFASILGTSGSGKTTLLNIIGGLDKYDDGDLIIDGISTKKYNDRDWDTYRNYRVGFIFQSYNLIMHQSVLANVEIALTLSGVSKKERKEKAIEALKKVGLKDHVYKKPNQLSGGQMQRVAIARALVNNPEIILADEPTGALDTKTSIQIMDLLKEIATDKLVIMVTHNPDLAKNYSTRIIELKDGLVVNDNNPFKEKEEIKVQRKTTKTSMSLLSALSLSYNNLLTKKGRTILTAFAGSIGIIGIALILSLSNGVNQYAKNLEKNSLSDFPITIERVNYDLFGSLAAVISDSTSEVECKEDKLCSNDDIVRNSIINSDKGLVTKNNLKEFKKYIENSDIKRYADNIKYAYDLDLQVYNKEYNKVNPKTLIEGKEINIFKEINDDNSKYEIIAGKIPTNYNEIVLVVGNKNTVSDSILYSLGIKDSKQLTEDLQKISKDSNYRVSSVEYSFEDILNKSYKLILNTDYYKEEGEIFIDYSNNNEYMKKIIDNGIDIKIVGIVKEKDLSENYLAYNHSLTEHIINEISKTNIYKKQINNKDINVLTGNEFDGITNSFESNSKKLGIYELDDPSSISIYPKDFESKQKIIDSIEKYNSDNSANHREDLTVKYQDLMKSLVNSITNVTKIISMVLIAFVAISLVVSSIMIAIITYISVLERTKEIGILRAIGASKKDIKRVFRAETIIEGLIAGIFGIGIAFVLTFLINTIVKAIANIDSIASMPIMSAIILILLSVLLNVIAGTKPSSMAAKKDPVEALRTE